MNENGISKQPLAEQKRNRRAYNPKTRGQRWKWMTAAATATAGGVAQSHAGTITVTLSDNFISATGGNHLNADLTGDGQPDITIANAAYTLSYVGVYHVLRSAHAGADLNGVLAFAGLGRYDNYSAFLQIGSQTKSGAPPKKLEGSIPISFNDLQINNGRLTRGFLEVTATANQTTNFFAKVQLDSFTYNTNIPDQGSSLALLALGAAGLLAFRRLRSTRERSLA